MLSLRRVAMAADSTANAYQPVDDLIRSGFTGKFLVPEASPNEFNLHKLAPCFHAAVDFFTDSCQPARRQSDTFTKSPPYIVLSVLNL